MNRDRALLLSLIRRGNLEHYADPELYDHEYKRRRVDVNYYRTTAKRYAKNCPILELGCGSGRVLIPLLQDDHYVVGVDHSREMLGRLKARLDKRQWLAERASLVHDDFRRFQLGKKFNLVLCPFNAMMHLYSLSDAEAFFGRVRAHLKPDGIFTFDVLNPDLQWLSRRSDKRWSKTRFRDPVSGELSLYSTNHIYDAATQIAIIRIYYESLVRPYRRRTVHLSHRHFFPQELRALIKYNGFEIIRHDGGFEKESLTVESDEQVMICRLSRRRSRRSA